MTPEYKIDFSLGEDIVKEPVYYKNNLILDIQEYDGFVVGNTYTFRDHIIYTRTILGFYSLDGEMRAWVKNPACDSQTNGNMAYYKSVLVNGI